MPYLEKMDEHLVSDQILQYLSRELGDEWKDLARHLDTPEGQLHTLREENKGDIKEAKFQILLHWIQRQGQQATPKVLAEALSNVGRGDLSDKVLKDHPSPWKDPLTQLMDFPPPVTTGKRTQFVKELRTKYKRLCGGIQQAPFLRAKYHIDELFVESKIEFREAKHGESKKHEKWRQLKNYQTIFTEREIKSKRRILVGEPGYGKSTLALKITHDWCQEIAPMKEFQILILLRLRQFKDEATIYSAIKKFLLPEDSKLTKSDIKSILDCSSTAILLDGYDECPDRGKEGAAIERINKEEMCQDHEVVLTTRTSCLPPDHENTTNKLVRLCGFDEDSRKMYIRNVIARGCSDVADKISKFLKENPVAADFCKIPLLFAMICCMVKNSESFQNLKTVTQFFRHIIKCFHSHKDIKITQVTREEKLDHSKLDKVAFEGLSGDGPHIPWSKNKLIDEISKDLYDEYIHIGILVEEEVYDHDTLTYYTETRFFHKLFAEWHAAHYLAKVAAQPEAEFEPWQKRRRLSTVEREEGKSPPNQASNNNTVRLLKNLDPNDVNYMYRFACGLNRDAGLKIIKHLGTKEGYDKYTLLCIKEWGGNLETIRDTVSLLCSSLRIRFIRDTDSIMLQKSTVALIDFASSRKIPIDTLWLYDCLDNHLDATGGIRVKPSHLTLPVIQSTLRKLRIYEYGRKLTEKETEIILQYSAKCLEVKKLEFRYCLLPRYINVNESLQSILGDVSRLVKWNPGSRDYLLNLESGEWEDRSDYTPMTDKEYERAEDDVDRYAEWRKEKLEK